MKCLLNGYAGGVRAEALTVDTARVSELAPRNPPPRRQSPVSAGVGCLGDSPVTGSMSWAEVPPAAPCEELMWGQKPRRPSFKSAERMGGVCPPAGAAGPLWWEEDGRVWPHLPL